jgi:uncharacterized protein
MKKLNLFLLIGLFGSLNLFAMDPSEGVGASSIEEVVSQEEAEQCSICHEKLEKDNLLSPYTCKHGFHKDCIEQWFEQPGGGLCPYCRSEKKPAPVEVQPRDSRNNQQLEELDNQLIEAAKDGRLGDVNRLLEAGANVNILDDLGWIPLPAAARFGHLEIVNRLLEVPDIDVNAANGYRDTALIWAAFKRHLDILQKLIDAGANVNHHGFNGTALAEAAERNHLDVIAILRGAGAIE